MLSFFAKAAFSGLMVALIATVASWLIIIVYLWFRFKSLIYGLAAVLAVVHDVLVTLGAVAVTWGAGEVDLLNAAVPDAVVGDVPALRSVLLP